MVLVTDKHKNEDFDKGDIVRIKSYSTLMNTFPNIVKDTEDYTWFELPNGRRWVVNHFGRRRRNLGNTVMVIRKRESASFDDKVLCLAKDGYSITVPVSAILGYLEEGDDGFDYWDDRKTED